MTELLVELKGIESQSFRPVRILDIYVEKVWDIYTARALALQKGA
jgi:hypothetical protein